MGNIIKPKYVIVRKTKAGAARGVPAENLLGTTGAGKPVRRDYDNPKAWAEYSADDHHDAAKIHQQHADKFLRRAVRAKAKGDTNGHKALLGSYAHHIKGCAFHQTKWATAAAG